MANKTVEMGRARQTRRKRIRQRRRRREQKEREFEEQEYEGRKSNKKSKASKNNKSSPAIANDLTVVPTSSPIAGPAAPEVVSFSPSASASLSEAPTSSSESTEAPSVTTTTTTTVSPTTETQFKCFETTQELYDAVDDFMEDDSPNAPVILKYGPIEEWCVKDLTSFRMVFSADRNPRLVDFNKDLSLWDLSSATSTSYMFSGAKAFTGEGGLALWNVSKVTDMSGMVSLFVR